MRALGASRTSLVPGGVLAGPWVRNDLWRRARAVPSLDLRFADNKSLTDAVTGASLITFTRASNGTYTDSAGVLQTAATNEPRFGHNPTTGESLGLLVEEQRTNLVQRSEEFDNALWAKNGTPTVTANSSVAPDGTTTAELFTRTTTGPTFIQQILVKAASALTYTFSVYAKQSVGNFIALRVQGAYPARADVVFNLSTGAIASAASAVAGFASASATITPFVNGWYRLALTATTDAVTNLQAVISVNSNGGQVDGTDSVSNSACFLWGAQLEAGAFPTSYILNVNTASGVTRNADVCSITGSAFSGWYRQDEGTVYVDGSTAASTATTGFVSINAAANTNRLEIRQSRTNPNTTGASTDVAWTNIVPQITLVANTLYKQATAFSNASHGNSIEGSLDTSSTTIGTIAATQLFFGIRSNQAAPTGGSSSTIRRIAFWPQRLANSTLQALSR